MSKSFLFTTSAVALCLTLPAQATFAQEVEACGIGVGTPCMIEDQEITEVAAEELPQCLVAEGEFPCLTGIGDVIADVETLAEVPPEDLEPRMEDVASDAAPEAEENSEVASEEATEAATEEVAEQPAETNEDGEAAENAEAQVEETAEQAETSTSDNTEAAAEATTENAAPEPAEESAESEAAEQPTEDMPKEEAAEADPTTEEKPAEDMASDESSMSETSESAEAVQPTIIEDEAPATAAAAATESDGTETEQTADAEVVVEEETVTEDSARSSSEEFETGVSESSEGAEATAEASSGKTDEGLSKFEKALLVGLGAIAVGQILDNGDEIVSNSGDRVVVRRNGEFRVLKDDDALLRQPGNEVRTERFADGSTRTTVTRPDGRKTVTIRAADGQVLRRVRVFEDGTRVVLFDDTEVAEPVDVTELPKIEAQTVKVGEGDDEALRAALEAALARDLGRSFSLRQVREIRQVRELAPEIEVDAITFETGSSAIRPSQAEELADLGLALKDLIVDRPDEVFLIEGHTDAVGSASLNLALSDRRAETVALALTEYFDVPPENLVVQGYGESALKIQTDTAEEANRRATVRRITGLLGTQLAKDF